MQKADHSGHRARMKKKLIANGIDAFEPHEVLEIMLYYAIPQRNTNDIAKNLIARYGSLSAVLDASLDSLKDAMILNKFIGYEETEHVFLLLMDKKGKEVYSGMIAHGDFDSAGISIRQIVTLAINFGATSAILAHSHPSGLALPSKSDVLTTRSLKEALKLVNITLLDHFIVADHDCVSLAESGII